VVPGTVALAAIQQKQIRLWVRQAMQETAELLEPDGRTPRLLRGSASFDDLDAERVVLTSLPVQPAMTWEEMTVRVTRASDFMCRHMFYTVPKPALGHRLRLRSHDDRIEAYLGGNLLLSLPRGRRPRCAGVVEVVDYHHVIAAPRAKPGALAHLAYLDALWPRAAYRRAWDARTADGPVRDAARTMVGLLALAHDRGVEADLAGRDR
jgi:hypothetical protein